MIDYMSLTAFMAAYALCLATPGPNMMMLAATALQGRMFALSAAAGIALGATALCLSTFVLGTAALATVPRVDEFNRIFAASLMVFIGMLLLEKKTIRHNSAMEKKSKMTWLVVGFATAVTNPISMAFFAAQFVGPLRRAGLDTAMAAIVSVPVLALLYSGLVAALVTRPSVRDRVLANANAARRVIAGMFFLFAIAKITPLIPDVRTAAISLDPRFIVEVCGFGAGAMTVTAFFCSSMVKLRAAAICANLLFIAYGIGHDLFPILLLHAVLLPVNVARYLVLRRRVSEDRGAWEGSRVHTMPVAHWPIEGPSAPRRAAFGVAPIPA